MIGWTYPEFVAAVAGLAGGTIVGAAIITPTEMKIREFHRKPARGGALGVFLYATSKIVIVAAFCLVITLSILRLGGIGALKSHLSPIFGVAFLAGGWLGKYARYLYWMRRSD